MATIMNKQIIVFFKNVKVTNILFWMSNKDTLPCIKNKRIIVQSVASLNNSCSFDGLITKSNQEVHIEEIMTEFLV